MKLRASSLRNCEGEAKSQLFYRIVLSFKVKLGNISLSGEANSQLTAELRKASGEAKSQLFNRAVLGFKVKLGNISLSGEASPWAHARLNVEQTYPYRPEQALSKAILDLLSTSLDLQVSSRCFVPWGGHKSSACFL